MPDLTKTVRDALSSCLWYARRHMEEGGLRPDAEDSPLVAAERWLLADDPPPPQHCGPLAGDDLAEVVRVARMLAARQLAPSPHMVASLAKALLTVVDGVQERDALRSEHTVRSRLERLIASLDRVCPSCLAATSKETWEQLHEASGKMCPAWVDSEERIRERRKRDLAEHNADPMDDLQPLVDALRLRCRRCGGQHLTMRREEPIENVPGIGTLACESYVCRDCGLDSKDASVP